MNWQHERSMTPEQFQGALGRLFGPRPMAAAGRFMGTSARQVARWFHGKQIIPVTVVLLLNSMIHHDEKPVVPRRIPGSY